ncbi:MAG: hypothetical protein ACJ8LG_17700 [Massilia sp.]
MDTTIRPAPPPLANASAARSGALARTRALEADPRPARATPAAAQARTPAPLKRGVAGWDSGMQDEVARAQQALDYLDQVASQLEALKGQLAARLSGARGDEQQLQARLRELASSLAARRDNAGGGLDARLDFNGGKPALQRFRIRGLDLATLQSGGAQDLAFSVGSAGGPQLSVSIEAGLSRKEIAQRLDRALAPLKVRAQLDERGELVFSTDEANWPGIKDSIAISGRGRVATEEEAPAVNPQGLDTINTDAVRQSLREVVQALARVRRSQEAANAALGDATARASRASAAANAANAANATQQAQDFASTASSPDYNSLLAITSALVGVSRERVLALLGLR